MLNKGMLFSSLLVKDVANTFVFSSCIKTLHVSDIKDFEEEKNLLLEENLNLQEKYDALVKTKKSSE
jgi:hypothetical protein